MADTIRGASWAERERRPGWGRRTALIGGAVLLAVAALVAVGLWSLNASIDRVGVDGLGEGPPVGASGDADGDGRADEGADEEELDPRALTVLVLGSDSREVLTPEERRELGTGDAEGERTEVISLARLDPDDGEVRLLSIPRDTLLTRCDGTSGRVNAAYAIGELDGRGGATCVVQTLSNWMGVRIDHVVKVDFRGFVDIVDALGGVSMYVEEPLQDDNANLDLEAGCVRLDGADALAFVRARHIDNDFGRMGRQQRFVTELRNELASVGVFDDPARTFRVAEAVAQAVELDDTLTLNRIQQLAREHRATVRGGLEGQVVPGDIETIDGAAYVVVDEQRTRELLRWLMTGQDPAEQNAAGEGAAGEGATTDGSGGTDAGTDGATPDVQSDTGAEAAEGDGTDADTPSDDVTTGAEEATGGDAPSEDEAASVVERSETCR
ncbi:LCP family protein [Egicoccus sp. AB-alg2]|uniref:LCP family protein n=1 Tax=Egicoccus sp. AB-alg2 TaxID=3242693 RepID=UPI00359E3106